MKNSNINIHIIGGGGQMGNWLKNFLESQKYFVSVSGKKDRSNNTIENADILFISVPISQAPLVIRKAAPLTKSQCLLVDLSSVKEQTTKALIASNRPAIGIHLLFGPTVTSMNNQKIVFCVIKKNRIVDKLREIFEANGAEIIEMNSTEHDIYMVNIQNMVHGVNFLLAKIFLKNKIDLNGRISTPVSHAQVVTLTRVLSQDPKLLTEIQLSNHYYPHALDVFIKETIKLKNILKKNDTQKLKNEIEKLHIKIKPTRNVLLGKAMNKKIKRKTVPHIKGSIAYLGPEGTFSHQAALTISKRGNLIACQNIYDIFNRVQIGSADFGLVPLENSTEGTVRESLDYLIDFDLKTNFSIDIPIHQNLLSTQQSIGKINAIISHPQAIAQCRKWITDHMQNAQIQYSTSTMSETNEKIPENVALIGSKLAARIYNLRIVSRNIEDNPLNRTKFVLISKHINVDALEYSEKTLLFLTVFNRIGILRDILSVLAKHQINLSKIESRPSRKKAWDYHFFIEAETHIDNEILSESLTILRQYCPVIKILGGI